MTVMPDLFFRWVWSLGVPPRERELPRPSVAAALLVHSLPLEGDRSASQALPPGFPEDRAPRVCGVSRRLAGTGLGDAESGRRRCAPLPAGGSPTALGVLVGNARPAALVLGAPVRTKLVPAPPQA